MKKLIAVLFALMIFAAVPATFADEAPVQNDAAQTETVEVEAVDTAAAQVELEAAEQAEVLEALGVDPLFEGETQEAVCHPVPCQYSGCPYQYPTCLWNGCCG